MSHNYLLDLYAFLDDQMARANRSLADESATAASQAWSEGQQSAWNDLRCFIDNQFHSKLPKRLQKRLAGSGTAPSSHTHAMEA